MCFAINPGSYQLCLKAKAKMALAVIECQILTGPLTFCVSPWNDKRIWKAQRYRIWQFEVP